MIVTASKSVTEAAYRALRAAILAGGMRPGSRLKINELCTAMTINVSAVREALSRLSSEGLVIAEPQRGFRVAPISPQDLKDVTSARIEVEALCLRRSLAVGDIQWEATLVGAYHALATLSGTELSRDPQARERWSESHAAFHAALCGACDNSWLLRLRDLLYVQSERYRQFSTAVSRHPRPTQEHKRLLEAALARDADGIVTLMKDHLTLTMTLLLEALPELNGDGPTAHQAG